MPCRNFPLIFTVFYLHRTGVCLPFVCKDFRIALLDLQHVRLWGTVAPHRCVYERYVSIGDTPERTLSLQQWLQARATAMRVLHIRWAQAALHGRSRLHRMWYLLLVCPIDVLTVAMVPQEVWYPLAGLSALGRAPMAPRNAKPDTAGGGPRRCQT